MAGFREQAYYCFSDSHILKGFDAICKTWFKVIKDYSEICKNEDAIYWYNERASLSSFCAALGRRGITFMEEYSSLKGQGENENKKSALSHGRVDLCFFHNDSWYIAEAKYLKRYFTPNGLQPALLSSPALAKASQDAERSQKGDPGCHALGLTFVTLSFGPNLYDTMNKQLAEFIHELPEVISKLQKTSRGAFLAYCAPKNLRQLKSDSGWYFPMTLLLGKIVRKAKTT
ncbi:MAG: hypothetical protein LBB34_04855 [Holosporales bacterium]|jgi:hypothetical protein|nr:hypothetical protein [Holosporales bacterium]